VEVVSLCVVSLSSCLERMIAGVEKTLSSTNI
jgi:hypothetical protein